MEIITIMPNRAGIYLIYGEPKIGKSSLAASYGYGDIVFIQTENPEVIAKSFPLTRSYNDILSQLNSLCRESHQFKALAFDSLSAAQEIIHMHVLKENGLEEINAPHSFGYGYSKAHECWEEIARRVKFLSQYKGMDVILLGHTKVSRFEDPERDSYNKHDVDLRDKTQELFYRMVSCIGFMTRKVVLEEKKEAFGAKTIKATQVKGVTIKFTPNGPSTAGNRYELPPVLDIPITNGWDVIRGEVSKFLERKRAEVERLERLDQTEQPPKLLEETDENNKNKEEKEKE